MLASFLRLKNPPRNLWFTNHNEDQGTIITFYCARPQFSIVSVLEHIGILWGHGYYILWKFLQDSWCHKVPASFRLGDFQPDWLSPCTVKRPYSIFSMLNKYPRHFGSHNFLAWVLFGPSNIYELCIFLFRLLSLTQVDKYVHNYVIIYIQRNHVFRRRMVRNA